MAVLLRLKPTTGLHPDASALQAQCTKTIVRRHTASIVSCNTPHSSRHKQTIQLCSLSLGKASMADDGDGLRLNFATADAPGPGGSGKQRENWRSKSFKKHARAEAVSLLSSKRATTACSCSSTQQQIAPMHLHRLIFWANNIGSRPQKVKGAAYKPGRPQQGRRAKAPAQAAAHNSSLKGYSLGTEKPPKGPSTAKFGLPPIAAKAAAPASAANGAAAAGAAKPKAKAHSKQQPATSSADGRSQADQLTVRADTGGRVNGKATDMTSCQLVL